MLFRQRPEQAPEHDRVGEPVHHGVEERAQTAVLASKPGHSAVEDVQEPRGEQEDAGQEPAIREQQPSDHHVVQERSERELPRTDAGPV